MTELWWNKFPKWAGRLSQWWAMALTDGYFLLAFPARVTNVLSPSIFVLGLLCGFFSPGYKFTPVEAPIILYCFLFIGILSSHLGVFLLSGFAIGDFLASDILLSDFDFNWRCRLIFVKLHEYIIFGIGIVQIALFSKQLTALFIQGILPKIKVYFNNSFGQPLFFALISALNLLLVGYLTFLWAHSMALLIRTTYSLVGLDSSIVGQFQIKWPYLVGVALTATSLRLIGQWRLVFIETAIKKAEEYEAKIQGFIYRSGWLNQLPKWANALWSGAFLTILLSGAFITQFDTIFFFILATALYTFGAYSKHLKLWPDWMINAWRIPFVWRFLIAAIVAYGLVQSLMPYLFEHSGGTFWPVLIPTLLSLLIFSLILPAENTEKPKTSV
jgi:hypothetical protein